MPEQKPSNSLLDRPNSYIGRTPVAGPAPKTRRWQAVGRYTDDFSLPRHACMQRFPAQPICATRRSSPSTRSKAKRQPGRRA